MYFFIFNIVLCLKCLPKIANYVLFSREIFILDRNHQGESLAIWQSLADKIVYYNYIHGFM